MKPKETKQISKKQTAKFKHEDDDIPIPVKKAVINLDDLPIGGGKKLINFDDIPISVNKNANKFDEMPVGGGKGG